ncbi:hypothetical protein CBL_21330, partial [Carabus blaptoides fortunei]
SAAGPQRLLDIATCTLETMGLKINPAKSHTVALRNIPQEKQSVIDSKCKFKCGAHTLPAITRSTEWTYLAVPFTPEGRHSSNPLNQLQDSIERVHKAPLKPQQRMLILRVYLLPGLYHKLTLGGTTIGLLRKLDALTRRTAR